jgi:hypothetical protein
MIHPCQRIGRGHTKGQAMKTASLVMGTIGALFLEMFRLDYSRDSIKEMSDAELRDRIKGDESRELYDTAYVREWLSRHGRAR